MKPRTLATLNSLKKENWFCNVGGRGSSDVVVLPTWIEAIATCSSVEWENLCLDAANQYRQRIFEKDPIRYSAWNDIVDEMKAVTIPLVQEKIEKVVAENNLSKIFEDTVQWDILHLFMEAEYSDVYPPGFYAAQAFWYVNGRFPCGWSGDFPDGKLIIF